MPIAGKAKVIVHPNKYRKLNPALIRQIIGKGVVAASTTLVAWWKMNEGSGYTLGDSSGNSNPMTLAGNANWQTLPAPYSTIQSVRWDNGVRNAALTSGTSAALLNFSRTQAWSASAWLCSITNPGYGFIIGNLDSTNNYSGWALYYANGELLVQILHDNSTNYIAVTSSTGGSIVTGGTTVFHLAATYNGSSTAAGVKIYINGVAVTTVVGTDGLTGAVTSTQPTGMGTVPNQQYQYGLNALETDVRLYTGVLSSAQVSTLYSTGPV
jgi:hypothetical protein